jgi:methylmalonyl-CoA mutase N-terminal domain/subunit
MPYVVTAVKAYATMGEIMDVFETEHGAYREKIGLA